MSGGDQLSFFFVLNTRMAAEVSHWEGSGILAKQAEMREVRENEGKSDYHY